MALYTFFQKRYVSASIWLDLASFSWCEAVACPILALVAWRRGRPLWQSALFFEGAAVVVGFRRGLPESCTFVLDRAILFDRLYRLAPGKTQWFRPRYP